jgi:hypothetical protein
MCRMARSLLFLWHGLCKRAVMMTDIKIFFKKGLYLDYGHGCHGFGLYIYDNFNRCLFFINESRYQMRIGAGGSDDL